MWCGATAVTNRRYGGAWRRRGVELRGGGGMADGTRRYVSSWVRGASTAVTNRRYGGGGVAVGAAWSRVPESHGG
ncbi:MAG: hypothetical protein AAGF95_28470 [Chloroflexota bacterium]